MISLKKTGLVIGVEQDLAKVSVMRQSSCGGECSSCSGCGDSKPTIVKVKNEVDAKIGDLVELQGSSNILKLTFMLYSIPLILFVVGLVAGAIVFKNKGYANYEIISFIIGIASLVISFLILKLIDKKFFERDNSLLTINRIIN